MTLKLIGTAPAKPDRYELANAAARFIAAEYADPDKAKVRGDTMRASALAAIDAGYNITEVRVGGKAPTQRDWQNKIFRREDVAKLGDLANYGIKTGQQLMIDAAGDTVPDTSKLCLLTVDFDRNKDIDGSTPALSRAAFRGAYIKRESEEAHAAFMRVAGRDNSPNGNRIYCHLPEGIEVRGHTGVYKSEGGDKIDMRCKKNQVLAHGSQTASITDTDGNVYQHGGHYAWEPDGFKRFDDLPVLPMSMVEWLTEKRVTDDSQSKPHTGPVSGGGSQGAASASTPADMTHGRASGSNALGLGRQLDEHGDKIMSKQDPLELLAKNIFYMKSINAAVKKGAPYPFADRTEWIEQIMFPWAHLEAKGLGVLPGEGVACFEAVCRADDRYDASLAASCDDLGQYAKAVVSAATRRNDDCDTYETIHKTANVNKWDTRHALRKRAIAAAGSAVPQLTQRVAMEKLAAVAEQAKTMQDIASGLASIGLPLDSHSNNASVAKDAKIRDNMDSAQALPADGGPPAQGLPFLDPQAPIQLETAASRFTFIQNYGGKNAVFDAMDPDNMVSWEVFEKTRQEKVYLAEGGSAIMGKLMANDPTARVTADKMEFLPGMRRGVVIHNGLRTLNMFGGYPVDNYLSANVHMIMSADEAYAKSQIILQFLFEVVSQGDLDFYNYIFYWLAWKLQYPHLQTEVAPVFLGEQGSGKSAFFQLLKAMFGRYARSFNSPSALFQEFNAFLQTVLIAWLEEGTNTTNFKYDDMSKDLITNEDMFVNRKSYGQIFVPNYLTLGFNTNRPHAVQADGDARRLVIQRVDVVWKKHGPEWEAFFTAIKGPKNRANTRAGLGEGAIAFWQYMRTVPLGNFHPAKDIIATKAKAEQKKLSEGITIKGYIWHLLGNRRLTGAHPNKDWTAGPVTLDKQEMDSLITGAMVWRTDQMRTQGKRRIPEFTDKGVSMALAKHLNITSTRSNSVSTWYVPQHNTAVGHFETLNDCVGSV